MSLLNLLFGSPASSNSLEETTQVNPANGLPMTSPGVGGVDVEGNPFGTDSSFSNDICSSDSFSLIDNISCFDNSLDSSFDSFDSGCSSFDDW